MTRDLNLTPENPASKGNPVRDSLIGLLFRQQGLVTLADAGEKVDAFLREHLAIAHAQESLDLLAQVYPQVHNPEDRAHIRELMSVTTPYVPEAK